MSILVTLLQVTTPFFLSSHPYVLIRFGQPSMFNHSRLLAKRGFVLAPKATSNTALFRPTSTNSTRNGNNEAMSRRYASTEAEESYNFGSYSVILPEEPFVFGVSHIKPRPVPDHIRRPPYVSQPDEAGPAPKERLIELGTKEEDRLRRAASLARDVRQFAAMLVKPGVTTNEVDGALHEFIVAHGAYPSPLLYQGFPRSCCTSINNVIAHGIPDDRPLESGDIVNVDVTVYLDGYHGDTSQTFLVGAVDFQGRELIQITNGALERAIAACGPGRPFRMIGDAISGSLKDKDYCVSTQFTGHGIGRSFHSPPWILHHQNEEPGIMKPGQCFTIEPAIIQGTNPRGWIFPDGWTASTENCARSAQAEHMVLITDTGAEVLTR